MPHRSPPLAPETWRRWQSFDLLASMIWVTSAAMAMAAFMFQGGSAARSQVSLLGLFLPNQMK